jgi:hypothetical protein
VGNRRGRRSALGSARAALGASGGHPVWPERKAVPAYGSGGWLSYTDEQLADEVTRYVARGFAGVKLKVGGDEDRDVERVRAVSHDRRNAGSSKRQGCSAQWILTVRDQAA